MMRCSLLAVAAIAGASLFGCGSAPSPEPTPTPVPYEPKSVAEAWANHLDGFLTRDLEKIMLDYDEESVLQIANDDCNPVIMQEFVGVVAIKGFFMDLFATLTDEATEVVPAFTDEVDNPTSDDAMVGGSYDAANVFLVWHAPTVGIEKATDTFMFKEAMGVVKIKKQNIVSTQECPSDPGETPADPAYDATGPLGMGWDNHLAAFGEQNQTKILMDYTEDSTIQVYTWNAAQGEANYMSYAGTMKIGMMFDALWASMNAQEKDGTIGLEVDILRVEDAMMSVFLVWHSYSNPKATDTFLFDANGKITRQLIVTTLGTAPEQKVVV